MRTKKREGWEASWESDGKIGCQVVAAKIFTWKHEGRLLAAKTSQINWSLQSKTTFPGFVTISIPYED